MLPVLHLSLQKKSCADLAVDTPLIIAQDQNSLVPLRRQTISSPCSTSNKTQILLSHPIPPSFLPRLGGFVGCSNFDHPEAPCSYARPLHVPGTQRFECNGNCMHGILQLCTTSPCCACRIMCPHTYIHMHHTAHTFLSSISSAYFAKQRDECKAVQLKARNNVHYTLHET